MKGIVTEIQRFSLNDGTGIRTSIFLKGCNMNCQWCHNPETINQKKELMFYPENCISCYKCVVACPSKAHKKIDGQHRFFESLCVQCGKCAAICYAQALVMSGTLMTVEDILFEVRQDKAYYDNSSGGVTISGGEVLYQSEFATALAAACKAEKISVAIETNLNFSFSKLEEMLPYLDFVFCDLKIWDNDSHHSWTGVGNQKIIDNIKKLDNYGIPFVVRTPLIPGATDSEENIRQISEFLEQLTHLEYYELLNFNPLGDSKYKSLRQENPFEKTRPLSEARLDTLAKIAGSFNLMVRVS